MRHRKSGRKLSRTSSHRLAMFKNMMASLVVHERIKTTVPKAKELRRFIEPLVTLSGSDKEALHIRRLLIQRLDGNKAVINKLIDDLGPFYKSRPGGYVRIIKCGKRMGDQADMAYVMFVDRHES